MGPRHAFRRAQSFANETGKTAWVVYNTVIKRYEALSELPEDDDVEMMTLQIIQEVEPCKSR
jgi:hypothetical protein